MWNWDSPNGVVHIVEDDGYCATCGRHHERSTSIAEQLVEDIIAEVDGDLELAIRVVAETQAILEGRKAAIIKMGKVVDYNVVFRFDNDDITSFEEYMKNFVARNGNLNKGPKW